MFNANFKCYWVRVYIKERKKTWNNEVFKKNNDCERKQQSVTKLFDSTSFFALFRFVWFTHANFVCLSVCVFVSRTFEQRPTFMQLLCFWVRVLLCHSFRSDCCSFSHNKSSIFEHSLFKIVYFSMSLSLSFALSLLFSVRHKHTIILSLFLKTYYIPHTQNTIGQK